jgi:hypothetical protein
MNVTQAEGVRAVRGRLDELHETQARLLARKHTLSHVLARRFNTGIPLPPDVADVSVPAAARETADIDRELGALERRIDAEQAALALADVAAQATILEAEMPEYRQLVEARDRAKAVLAERETDIQAFLTGLRSRGCFQQPPLIAERG